MQLDVKVFQLCFFCDTGLNRMWGQARGRVRNQTSLAEFPNTVPGKVVLGTAPGVRHSQVSELKV